MSEKLLPCPFCGGGAEIRDDSRCAGGFCVVCSSIDCYAALGEAYDRDGDPWHSFLDAPSAIAAWNRRAPSHEQHALPDPGTSG